MLTDRVYACDTVFDTVWATSVETESEKEKPKKQKPTVMVLVSDVVQEDVCDLVVVVVTP